MALTLPPITGWPFPWINGVFGIFGDLSFSGFPDPLRIIVAIMLEPLIVPCTITLSPIAMLETVEVVLFLVTLAFEASMV